MSFLSAREKVGMTQKEVAEAIGVDQSAVSFWETGKTSPRVSILVKLSGLYCCTVDDLLDKESKVKTETPPMQQVMAPSMNQPAMASGTPTQPVQTGTVDLYILPFPHNITP